MLQVTLLALLALSCPTDGDVTFKKEIRPIFEKRCAQCHNARWPDKNWLDYTRAKQHADRIKMRVWIQKNMPPGNFSGMTEDERKLVRDWVDNGAKE
jgi:uncharacterized membrane protein